MRELVYHVATSIDGFIAQTDGGIGGFLMEGSHGDDYLAALREDYDDVVMGRRTYEWGYRYGAIPGVVLKVNPFVMGAGIPLFGGGDRVVPMEAVSVSSYDNGVLLATYVTTR